MIKAKEKTKNDVAWECLFEKYKILDNVAKSGYFEIESAQINKVRESRLMAKFDHSVNLPAIFREHQLSILPISRYKYIIGNFETHYKVNYDCKIAATQVEFSENIKSIDPTNLYSEDLAINCAFNAGMINDLIGEETCYTVSGKMSTGRFSFNIKNSVNGSSLVNVNNSQCEIDAGFESQTYFLLIEAKNYSIDDFLIRQLYYPYRLWLSKISKKIIPVLMTYSNDIFSFLIYEFKDELNYNSLSLVEQKNYVIGSEQIQRNDLYNIIEEVKFIAETTNIPFPQADKFERVVDLISLLIDKDLTKDEITENYQFNSRQTNYYTDAVRYLGLVEKYKNSINKEITFRLTEEGKSLLGKRHKDKYLGLIKKILEHKIFYEIFELAASSGEVPSKEKVCKVMSFSSLNINYTTIERRATTVRKWIEWVWAQVD